MSAELHRRRFLALAGGTASALALGACSLNETARASEADSTTATSATLLPTQPVARSLAIGRPLLVVVNLGGGNDALNTVIPQSGRYHDLRPDVGIDDDSALHLNDDYALHPSLAPLLPHWQASNLAIAQGVGMTDQTRSHFAATDALFAGQVDYNAAGWIGRWLDQHPLAGKDPLLAVALGGGRGAVVGQTASSTVITRPQQFLLQTAPGMDPSALADVLIATATADVDVDSSDALTSVRAGIPRAIEAIQILDQIGVEPNATSVGDDSAQTLLSVAAEIVRLNVSTEVVMVNLSGFDTHAQQLETHAALLNDVASGIATMLETLVKLDRPRDTLVLTTSEFGRRAKDNGSGTDHGLAGSSLLIGARVKGGVVGDLAPDRLVDGDLPIQIDTRSVYAAAIRHLGGSSDDVLDGGFDDLGLIS